MKNVFLWLFFYCTWMLSLWCPAEVMTGSWEFTGYRLEASVEKSTMVRSQASVEIVDVDDQAGLFQITVQMDGESRTAGLAADGGELRGEGSLIDDPYNVKRKVIVRRIDEVTLTLHWLDHCFEQESPYGGLRWTPKFGPVAKL